MASESQFPLLDPEVLLSLPKAGKRRDLERMYTSRRSEDYVTWTLARLLMRLDPTEWWARLVGLADANAANGAGLDPHETPAIDVWRRVAAPPGYEQTSRARMAASVNEEWRARAMRPRPVEGFSEIDLVFDSPSALVFVEAKLGSDLSMSTTYDPDRNQLLRVVDCVIEKAGARVPRCWLIATDRHPDRRYTEIVDTYRRNLDTATTRLAHRDPERVHEVIDHLAVLTWGEILDVLPANLSDPALHAALAEVRRRL